MATGKENLTLLDAQGKETSVSFYTTLFTEVNFTALNGQIDDAVDAIMAVTECNKAKDERAASVTKFGAGLPDGDYALKGVRWLVRGVDTNGNSVRMQIPGANLALSANKKDLNLAAGEGLALKTALEAVWKSNDGESVTVVEVVYLDK